MSWQERLAHYRDEGMARVEGWVQKDLLVGIGVIQEYQNVSSIRGHVVEIGVHHGKFALALDTLRASDEKLLAIDIFEDQHLNVDGSGQGNRKIWDENVARFSHDPSGIITKAKDSSQLAPDEIERELGGKVRMFSIDGGHTMESALNDLEIAAASVTNGGLVVLDDFCSAGFAGVTEALFRYLFSTLRNCFPSG